MPFSLLILSLIKLRSSNSHILGIWLARMLTERYPATKLCAKPILAPRT